MSADDFIAVQPYKTVKWAVQYGFDSGDFPDPRKAAEDQLYPTLEEALRANEEIANDTEYGFRVITDPLSAMESTTFGEETLIKVYQGIMKAGIRDRELAQAIVSNIQNEGILFRERAKQSGTTIVVGGPNDGAIEPGDTPASGYDRAI